MPRQPPRYTRPLADVATPCPPDEDYLILDGIKSSDPAREQNLRARLLVTFESLQPELTSINLIAEKTRFDVCASLNDRQLDKREN